MTPRVLDCYRFGHTPWMILKALAEIADYLPQASTQLHNEVGILLAEMKDTADQFAPGQALLAEFDRQVDEILRRAAKRSAEYACLRKKVEDYRKALKREGYPSRTNPHGRRYAAHVLWTWNPVDTNGGRRPVPLSLLQFVHGQADEPGKDYERLLQQATSSRAYDECFARREMRIWAARRLGQAPTLLVLCAKLVAQQDRTNRSVFELGRILGVCRMANWLPRPDESSEDQSAEWPVSAGGLVEGWDPTLERPLPALVAAVGAAGLDSETICASLSFEAFCEKGEGSWSQWLERRLDDLHRQIEDGLIGGDGADAASAGGLREQTQAAGGVSGDAVSEVNKQVVYTFNIPKRTIETSDGRRLSFRTGNPFRLLAELFKAPGKVLEQQEIVHVLGSANDQAPKDEKYRLLRQLKDKDFTDLAQHIQSDPAGYWLDLPAHQIQVIDE